MEQQILIIVIASIFSLNVGAFCNYPQWTIPGTGSETVSGPRCEWENGCPMRTNELTYGAEQNETVEVHCANDRKRVEIWKCVSPPWTPGGPEGPRDSWKLMSEPTDCAAGKFFHKRKHSIMTCDWLDKKDAGQIARFCQKNTSYREYYDTIYAPPQKACCESCNSCDACYENPNTMFTMKKRKTGTEVYLRCSRLSSNPNKKAICKNTESESIFHPVASVACPKTCSNDNC